MTRDGLHDVLCEGHVGLQSALDTSVCKLLSVRMMEPADQETITFTHPQRILANLDMQ